MPIYALGNRVPDIHPKAYVHPNAVVIGDVHLAAQASVWPGAVLRGDDGTIVVGEATSIQDGSVLHCTPTLETVVGSRCVIGHIVHLEGCTIEDGALVGNGAIVLHRAVVHSGAMVAANAVVRAGTDVPSGSIAAGVPAAIREGAAMGRSEEIEAGVLSYIARAQRFSRELRRVD